MKLVFRMTLREKEQFVGAAEVEVPEDISESEWHSLVEAIKGAMLEKYVVLEYTRVGLAEVVQ